MENESSDSENHAVSTILSSPPPLLLSGEARIWRMPWRWVVIPKVVLSANNPPAMQETACSTGDPVWSLGQENPLEKEMAIHSTILVWKTPWTEEPGGL